MRGGSCDPAHKNAAPLLRAFAKPTPTDPPASPGLFAPSTHLPRVPWDRPPQARVPPNAPVSAAMQAGGGAKAEKSAQPSLICADALLRGFKRF